MKTTMLAFLGLFLFSAAPAMAQTYDIKKKDASDLGHEIVGKMRYSDSISMASQDITSGKEKTTVTVKMDFRSVITGYFNKADVTVTFHWNAKIVTLRYSDTMWVKPDAATMLALQDMLTRRYFPE